MMTAFRYLAGAVILMSLTHGLVSSTSSPVLISDVNHINSFQSAVSKDNTSLDTSLKKQKMNLFNGVNTDGLAHLANMMNFGNLGSSMGGLRTVMMGGMLYGLSLLPAIALALGGTSLPMGGLLSTLGLSKRALMETSSASLPLLSEGDTRRLLSMLHRAFNQWNIADDTCKQRFVCQMYRQVSAHGVHPDLDLFKEALLHVLENGSNRRAGRAAEGLLLHYEHYFEAARMGMDKNDCETTYKNCDLSLYSRNDSFQKNKKVEAAKPDGK